MDKGQAENLWSVGFFNRDTQDAFIGLFLEHKAENVGGLQHTGAPIFYYKWHGHVWSRALYHGATLPAGAVLRQKNAYLTLPFTAADGPAMVETLRHQLLNPLTPAAAALPANLSASAPAGRLARPGESGDSPIPKKLLWDALADCRDEQLYAAMPSVVDLGLIYDIRVRGKRGLRADDNAASRPTPRRLFLVRIGRQQHAHRTAAAEGARRRCGGRRTDLGASLGCQPSDRGRPPQTGHSGLVTSGG